MCFCTDTNFHTVVIATVDLKEFTRLVSRFDGFDC